MNRFANIRNPATPREVGTRGRQRFRFTSPLLNNGAAGVVASAASSPRIDALHRRSPMEPQRPRTASMAPRGLAPACALHSTTGNPSASDSAETAASMAGQQQQQKTSQFKVIAPSRFVSPVIREATATSKLSRLRQLPTESSSRLPAPAGERVNHRAAEGRSVTEIASPLAVAFQHQRLSGKGKARPMSAQPARSFLRGGATELAESSVDAAGRRAEVGGRRYVDSSEDSSDAASDAVASLPLCTKDDRGQVAAAAAPVDLDLAQRSTAAVVTKQPTSAVVSPQGTSPNAASSGVLPSNTNILQPATNNVDLSLLCQTLSGYSSFQCDCETKVWQASDQMLYRVLNYVQNMNYSVPLILRQHLTNSVSFGSLDEFSPNPGLNTTAARLFLPIDEALGWLAEQEYVIGAILLTCCYARSASPSADNNQGPPGATEVDEERAAERGDSSPIRTSSSRALVPAVPFDTNPVKFAANYVLASFPQWGSPAAFAEMWDSQYRIVLEAACPTRQQVLASLCPREGHTLYFSSDMECGNIRAVNPIAIGASTVHQVWIHADPGGDTKAWFRFSVSGYREGAPLCIRIMNLTAHERLYGLGMKPVVRASSGNFTTWRPIDDISFNVTESGEAHLSLFLVPPRVSGALHISYCIPYGYSDLLCSIARWHALVRSSVHGIRFEERVLCRTLDHRKLHLLIITNQTNDNHPLPPSHIRHSSGMTPYSDFSAGKKAVLLSGRVHPGEVTASHALHGVITFLLSSDPRAEKLRQHFVFFIVPMLNPDGVARGHWRHDQRGANLNRFFKEPDKTVMPTVASLKNVFAHLQSHFGERFIAFIDFHSHASRDRAFLFGNHLSSRIQCWNLLFAKLLSLHTSLFDFDGCKFGMNDMAAKEGTSRVLFGEALVHSYTMEVTPFTNGELDSSDAPQPILKESAEIGRAMLLALLDYCCITMSSKLHHYTYEKVLSEMRKLARASQVGARLLKIPTLPR